MNRCRILLFVLLVVVGVPAGAWPRYASKLGLPCLYCHKQQDGKGGLNLRGQYFVAHKYTFEGYDEEKVMGKLSPPLFHSAWTDTLPPSVLRIGVGDTAGDGKLRLVCLSSEAGSAARTITIQKWNGSAWITEFSGPAPGGGDRLAVGTFAAGRPAVIVTAGALCFWNGSAYQVKPAPAALGILGKVVLKDGAERLLVHQGSSVKLYRVDVAAKDWLVDPMDPPHSSATLFTDMKGPTKELEEVGMPYLLAAGGIVGLWDARKTDALFLYGVQVIGLVESKGDDTLKAPPKPGEAVPGLVLKGREVHLTVVDPRSATLKTLWHSDALPGGVLDIVVGDPKENRRGLLVLTDSTSKGPGHSLIFFQLD
ncbi:MAG: hypothetical protein ACP5VE_04900 [Chthonomonadales bacterium]